MILVDTSVWIDYFNGQQNICTDVLESSLIEGIVAIGDLIYLEILQGFRNDRDYNLAKATLGTLDQYEMLNQALALRSSENYRALRKRGITVRRTNAVIIATFCIENGLPLLFSDRDFLPFVENLGLVSALEET